MSAVAAIVGLLLPILSYFLPLVLGAIGLVLADIGFARSRRSDRSGKGLAIAGVVFGLFALVLGIVGTTPLNDVADSLGSWRTDGPGARYASERQVACWHG